MSAGETPPWIALCTAAPGRHGVCVILRNTGLLHRRLPEFKFWYGLTKAFIIAFVMTFFSMCASARGKSQRPLVGWAHARCEFQRLQMEWVRLVAPSQATAISLNLCERAQCEYHQAGEAADEVCQSPGFSPSDRRMQDANTGALILMPLHAAYPGVTLPTQG